MLGYRHYADDVLEYFVQKSVANGIDIIRIFDALNDIRNLQTAIRAAKKEGAHADSLPIFAHKAEIIPFKLLGVRTPAANIIKQEMLAVGGDAVTPVGAVTCAAKYVDILLLGTLKHYKVLLKKLAQMPYFGIPQAAIDLEMALTPQKLCTTLADGRVLTYEKMCVIPFMRAAVFLLWRSWWSVQAECLLRVPVCWISAVSLPVRAATALMGRRSAAA